MKGEDPVTREDATSIILALRRFDCLKQVERSDYVGNTNRHENAAEHTWHALLVAMAYKYLSDDSTIDYSKVYELLLIHDLPEIVAGDTPIFSNFDRFEVEARERAGLYEILKDTHPQFCAAIVDRWEDFESASSSEAKLAKVADRFQGTLQNLSSKGRAWEERHITLNQVVEITSLIREHGTFFSALLDAVMEIAREGRYLPPNVAPDNL